MTVNVSDWQWVTVSDYWPAVMPLATLSVLGTGFVSQFSVQPQDKIYHGIFSLSLSLSLSLLFSLSFFSGVSLSTVHSTVNSTVHHTVHPTVHPAVHTKSYPTWPPTWVNILVWNCFQGSPRKYLPWYILPGLPWRWPHTRFTKCFVVWLGVYNEHRGNQTQKTR